MVTFEYLLISDSSVPASAGTGTERLRVAEAAETSESGTSVTLGPGMLPGSVMPWAPARPRQIIPRAAWAERSTAARGPRHRPDARHCAAMCRCDIAGRGAPLPAYSIVSLLRVRDLAESAFPSDASPPPSPCQPSRSVMHHHIVCCSWVLTCSPAARGYRGGQTRRPSK